MKRIEVEITGTNPLIMKRFGDYAMEQLRTQGSPKLEKTIKTYPTVEEEAEDAAYRTDNGELYVPSYCIMAALKNAGTWYKMKNRSGKQLVSGSTRIEPIELYLDTKEYEIDTRPLPIPGKSNQRRLVSRPIFKTWKLSFTWIYDEKFIPHIDDLRAIIDEAGVRCGLLEHRPNAPKSSGSNGTFTVTKWNPINGSE